MEAQSKREILITGATGLLGKSITSRLKDPWRALRHGQEGWQPSAGTCEPSLLANTRAVIHLAGAPIASGRWTKARKQEIYDSRVNGTRALSTALAGLSEKPECLICASAIGFYGNRGEEVLHENAKCGEAFISEVVKDWEVAADAAREAGIRVVHLRLGIVLSQKGGALEKMLPPFKLGLGGRLGNGRMWMSWVDLDDAANAFIFAMEQPDMEGVFNLTAPHPLRNVDFTRQLATELKKPAKLPVPAAAIRLLLGEMGQELLLSSSRCSSAALKKQGFSFAYPELEASLHHVLHESDA